MGVAGLNQAMRQRPIGTDYNYFKTPPVAVPNAIIAIHKNYTLKSSSWSPIDYDAADAQGWQVRRGSMGSGPLLLEIQGPGGEHIGIWYSSSPSTVVKLLEDNVVQVYPPTVKNDTEHSR